MLTFLSQQWYDSWESKYLIRSEAAETESSQENLHAGKTTHLAQLMLNRGTVIALDRTHAKAQQIRYASTHYHVLSTYMLAYSYGAMPACCYVHACMFPRRHVVLDVLHQKRAAHAVLDQAGYAVIAAALLQ